MLMPDKHIRLAESLIGLGSFVLDALSMPKTMDDIWRTLQAQVAQGAYPARHSFENLVLAIDLLYALGAVTMSDSGAIRKCS